jgi:hypothetical protein
MKKIILLITGSLLLLISCKKNERICLVSPAPLFLNFITTDSNDVFVSSLYSLDSFKINHLNGSNLESVEFDTASSYLNGKKYYVISSQSVISIATVKAGHSVFYISFNAASTDTLTIDSRDMTGCIGIAPATLKYNGVEIHSANQGDFPLSYAARIVL